MSNELETRLKANFDEIAGDVKALFAGIGDLSSLNGTATDTSSAAVILGELFTLINGTGAGDMLNSDNLSGLTDLVQARSNLDVMSSAEVALAIAAVSLASLGGVNQAAVDLSISTAIDTVTGMPLEAFDTIQKISDELAADNTAFASLTNVVGNKVDFTIPQARTAAEKLQACQNLGIGDPNFDFLSSYQAIRDA